MDLEHERRLTAVEARSKSNEYRIGDIEKRQNNMEKLVSTVEALAVREKNVEDNVREIKKDVKSLTDRPLKKWDSLWEKILLTLVSAIIGFVLAKLGLN